MTQGWIREQIEALNAAAAKVKGSKKASLKFLIDAGIIKPKKKSGQPAKKKK